MVAPGRKLPMGLLGEALMSDSYGTATMLQFIRVLHQVGQAKQCRLEWPAYGVADQLTDGRLDPAYEGMDAIEKKS